MVGPVFAVFVGLALQGQQSITTNYLPSRDLPAAGQLIGTGKARYGMCNGMDELSLAYNQYRVQHPEALPLKDIIAAIDQQYSHEYLRQVMNVATQVSFQAGDPDYTAPSPPDFTKVVLGTLQKTGQPVSILLGGTQINHRVNIYAADPMPDGTWKFRLGDYEHAAENNLTLTYNPSLKTYVSNLDGKEIAIWTGAAIVTTPLAPVQKYLTVLGMAAAHEDVKKISHAVGTDVKPIDKLPKGAVIEKKSFLEEVKDAVYRGVLVRFDPDLFSGAIDESKLADIESRMQKFLDSGKDGAVIVNAEPRVMNLTMVPLKSLSPSKDLGGLTRVLGFVIRPNGDKVLVGIREPGMAPLPGEWLAVALQTIFEYDVNPFISLDPDPKTLIGAQKVRIGGVPNELAKTSFIKAMLEADYLMKRINLGKEKPMVDGFECWIDRMIRLNAQGAMRMWFMPYSLPVADAYLARKNGALAVVYESELQVLSEEEKMALEMGQSSGNNDIVSKDAGRDFTRCFNAMVGQYRAFQDLRGVFDVSKLAASWRAMKVDKKGLDEWLSYRPPVIPIKGAYDGIGPEMARDGRHLVSGGAIANPEFRAAGAVDTDAMAALIDAPDSGNVQVILPATIPIKETMLAGFQAQTLVERAQQNLTQGLTEEALARADQVLALDPEDGRAQLVRTIALGLQRKFPEAVAQAEKLTQLSPRMQALLAAMRASAGDYGGALENASFAEFHFPDDETVLIECVTARIIALDADGAARTLGKLREMCPGNPLLVSMTAQIKRIRFLGPERAKALQELGSQTPVPLARAMLESPNATRSIESYRKTLGEIDAGKYEVPNGLYVSERMMVAICHNALRGNMTPDELTFAATCADRMVSIHPDWASAHLSRTLILIAQGAEPATIAASFRRFAALEAKPDPVYEDLQLQTSLKQFAPQLAVLMYMNPGSTPEFTDAMLALSGELATSAAGEKLIRAIQAEKSMNVIEVLQSRGTRGVRTSQAEAAAGLLRIMAATEGVKSSDSVFPLAIWAGSVSAGFLDVHTPEFWSVLDHSMHLALSAPPSENLLVPTASDRADIWMQIFSGIAQPAFSPKAPLIADLQKLGPQMDLLKKAESGKADPAKLKPAMKAVADKIRAFVLGTRQEIGKGLSGIRTRYGDETADIVTFCVTEMQADLNIRDKGEANKVLKYNPAIGKTPEYQALDASMKLSSKGIASLESEDAAWARVLKGIRTKWDGLSVQSLLEKLATGGTTEKTSRLGRYLAQARAKTSLISDLD